MHEQVEPAVERLADLAEDSGNVVVGAHVAFGHERAGDGLGELAHALLDPLALNVNASSAPASASRFAIAQAIDRLFATPRTRPRLPSIASASWREHKSLRLDCDALRRSVGLLAVAAALVVRQSRPARALVPIQRTFGELTCPASAPARSRFRGSQRRGRVRVIVGCALAALAAAPRPRASRGSARARSWTSRAAASRRYLAAARCRAARRRSAAPARDPAARIGRRYQVVLDGFTVSLPVTKLPALARLGFVHEDLSERPLPPRDRHEHVGDRRDRAADADGRQGRRDQDRRSSTTASTARTRS